MNPPTTSSPVAVPTRPSGPEPVPPPVPAGPAWATPSPQAPPGPAPTPPPSVGWEQLAGPPTIPPPPTGHDPSPAGSGPGGGPPPSAPRTRPPRFAAPSRLVAVLVAVVALAFDLAAHQSVAAVATTLLVVVVVLALLASGRIRTRHAFALGIAAASVATFLSLRTSRWAVVLDVVAVVGLVLLTASYAAGGSIAAVTGSTIVQRFGRTLLSCVLAPSYALACAACLLPAKDEHRQRRLVAIARGIGIALPVVVVLALLLASADAVFASLFTVPDDLGSVLAHVGLFGLGAMLACVLFVEASAAVPPEGEPLGEPVGPTEATVVLASIVGLYAVFAAVQVVTLQGGATHVIETAGLTYADYARQGFFQLLAVVAITVVVVAGLRAWTKPGTRRQRVLLAALGELVIVLTLVIVAVAIRRLGLYEDAYGATMLRLACTAFAWWLGVALVLVGVALTGLGRRRRWLIAAVVTSALLALVAWNVVNPERLVVERNLTAARASDREVDVAYLWQLSDDAVPALAAALPELDEDVAAAVEERICFVPAAGGAIGGDRRTSGSERVVTSRFASIVLVPGAGAPGGPEVAGGLGANRSARLAADTRAEVCAR